MISVSVFKEKCLELSAKSGFGKMLMVAHEGHAVNALKDLSGDVLMVVLPSASRSGDPGCGIDSNATWFFALSKASSDQSNEKEIKEYDRLQQKILLLLNEIEERCEGGESWLREYSPENTKIEPEYREFGGWNGWSMSLVF